MDGSSLGIDDGLQPDLLGVGCGSHGVDRRLDDGHQAEGLHLEAELSPDDPGNVEQVVDDPDERPDAALHRLVGPGGGRLIQVPAAQHPEPGEHAGHGGAELVREGGEELVLGAARGGELLLALAQHLGERRHVVALAGERLLEHVARTLHGDEVADARAELLDGEGLQHVVLCPLPEQTHAQVLIELRRQHEDRRAGELALSPQRPHQLVASHLRHHDVGQHQVGVQGPGLLQTVAAVHRRRHLVVVRERVDQESAHLRMVLDHEDERPRAGLPAGARSLGTLRRRRCQVRTPFRRRALQHAPRVKRG